MFKKISLMLFVATVSQNAFGAPEELKRQLFEAMQQKNGKRIAECIQAGAPRYLKIEINGEMHCINMLNVACEQCDEKKDDSLLKALLKDLDMTEAIALINIEDDSKTSPSKAMGGEAYFFPYIKRNGARHYLGQDPEFAGRR